MVCDAPSAAQLGNDAGIGELPALHGNQRPAADLDCDPTVELADPSPAAHRPVLPKPVRRRSSRPLHPSYLCDEGREGLAPHVDDRLSTKTVADLAAALMHKSALSLSHPLHAAGIA